MVFLCKKTLVDLLSIRHFSEEVAFQTMEWPWDVLVFPWFTQIFTKLTEVSNHCNAPAAGLPFWCCCGLARLCSRISGPSSCGSAVIRIYRGNVHSLKPGKQHKPCVFWISPAPNGPEKLQKGAPNWMPKDSPKFLRLSLTQSNQCGWEAWHQEGVEWHICTPVSLNSRMPATWRSVSCGIPLAKAELMCTWYDTQKEQQLWDGLCILCLSIYFRFLQYVFITPWHEKIPTYPNHQPPLEGPHRRCQFSSTGANSTASALLPDAPGMKWLGENAPMFGHSTHRETDAQPIKVGDVPFNFQTAPVVPTKFAKRLPTDGDVWIILEWSFRQDPGNLCVFWWNNGHGWTEAPRQLAEP